MDIEDYRLFDGDILKEKIRSLSRAERDEQIRQFGTQYAFLCQRLEALYMPDRMDTFLAIRPGGLEEIDHAISAAAPSAKEVPLLKSFRELNRVLLPFMDVYEEQVLTDLKYMSQEELEALHKSVNVELSSAQEVLKKETADVRSQQNAGGTLRLGQLLKSGIVQELKDRFGIEVL